MEREKLLKFLSRRAFAFLIPAFAAGRRGRGKGTSRGILPTKAYPFESLQMRPAENTKTYAILHGNTHAGVLLDLHETELAAGAAPHPPHRHAHEEMLFVREGQVELVLADGTTRARSRVMRVPGIQ